MQLHTDGTCPAKIKSNEKRIFELNWYDGGKTRKSESAEMCVGGKKKLKKTILLFVNNNNNNDSNSFRWRWRAAAAVGKNKIKNNPNVMR